jgi:hypothetical protein
LEQDLLPADRDQPPAFQRVELQVRMSAGDIRIGQHNIIVVGAADRDPLPILDRPGLQRAARRRVQKLEHTPRHHVPTVSIVRLDAEGKALRSANNTPQRRKQLPCQR